MRTIQFFFWERDPSTATSRLLQCGAHWLCAGTRTRARPCAQRLAPTRANRLRRRFTKYEVRITKF